LQSLQFLAWLEANGFTWGDGDFGAGPGIATDASLAGPDVEDAETAQLNTFSLTKRSLHALKNGLDGHFSLRLCYSSLTHYFIDNIELDQDILPVFRR
jgi:hypothetical protein